MSTGFRLALIWILGGTIALIVALNWLPSVYFGGDILPTGHDSFYHARRILDAIPDPSAITQFDARIHAPEGSWVPWPWGYDYFMAWIARIAVSMNGNLNPMQALVYVPAAAAFITAALILAVAGALGLSLGLRLVAVLCFALSPLTQNVHGLGRIDHHFIEYTIVLLALLMGMRWLADASSNRNAVVCGAVFGAASVFHNGLFILQLPLLGAMAMIWFKGIRLPRRAAEVFAVSIVAATLAIVVPSAPFREGFFAYHLLSWFHLYVSFCTALCALLIQRLECDRTGIAVLAVAATGMLIPILFELRSGLGFVGTDILELKAMPETQSVFGGTGSESMSWWQAWQKYSGLVLLLPLVMLAGIWRALRGSDPGRIYFYTFTVFGAALLLVQYRFHTFGSFALYLPLLVWYQHWSDDHPRRWTWGALAAVLLAAYIPAIGTLGSAPVPGYSSDYVVTRSVYPSLAEACGNEPGVVLADHNDGHFIRFHTDCSVIANNLILTDQSREKIRKTRELFLLEPAQLRDLVPWVDFVLVRREDDVFDATVTGPEIRRRNRGLGASLLLDAPPFPAGYRLLHQVALQRDDGTRVVVARSFRIVR